jgi:CheY-like chemotaxis protein
MTAPSILVIDDDPDFVDITKTILETKDYTVLVAHNTDEGLARMEERTPDLIILDIMMRKGAEGVVFARAIRKDPRYSAIPILMLTSMREQILPVNEYVEKPIEPQTLLEKVGRLLAESRKNRV